MEGATRATGVASAEARSRGKLCIALVHHFHAEVGTVDHIRPSGEHSALGIQHRLVEVETIQVEGHGADSQ